VGHTGVLCDACLPGYFKGIDGRCAACGPAGDAAGRVVGVVLFAMFLLSVFLVRTVEGTSSLTKGDLTPTQVIIVTLKVLLNYLQTISIVALAQIDWPAGVASFFSLASSTSTLSMQGIGLECTLGASGKNPFVMLSMTMYVLLPLVLLYALAFWALYDPSKRLVEQLVGMCCVARDDMEEDEPWSATLKCSAEDFPRRMHYVVGLSAADLPHHRARQHRRREHVRRRTAAHGGEPRVFL